jgi:hypothetical protein
MFKNLIAGTLLVALGVLGILLDVGNLLGEGGFLNLPPAVARVLQIIDFLLVTMGIRELMLQSKASILVKLADLKSQTFWGTIIFAISTLTLNPETLPGLPPTAILALQILGVVFVALGWRDAGKRGPLSSKK